MGKVTVSSHLGGTSIHCYQALECSGGTGFAQRNFKGLWTLSEKDPVIHGYPHYVHTAPDGSETHLIKSGTKMQWMIGPDAKDASAGWACITSLAHLPEEIKVTKWSQWMLNSRGRWVPSKPLIFVGLQVKATKEDLREAQAAEVAAFREKNGPPPFCTAVVVAVVEGGVVVRWKQARRLARSLKHKKELMPGELSGEMSDEMSEIGLTEMSEVGTAISPTRGRQPAHSGLCQSPCDLCRVGRHRGPLPVEKVCESHDCAEDKVKVEEMDEATKALLRKNAKQCPVCEMWIQKNAGCDWMLCGDRAHGSLKTIIKNGGCGIAFKWNNLEVADDPCGWKDMDGTHRRGRPVTARQLPKGSWPKCARGLPAIQVRRQRQPAPAQVPQRPADAGQGQRWRVLLPRVPRRHRQARQVLPPDLQERGARKARSDGGGHPQLPAVLSPRETRTIIASPTPCATRTLTSAQRPRSSRSSSSHRASRRAPRAACHREGRRRPSGDVRLSAKGGGRHVCEGVGEWRVRPRVALGYGRAAGHGPPGRAGERPAGQLLDGEPTEWGTEPNQPQGCSSHRTRASWLQTMHNANRGDGLDMADATANGGDDLDMIDAERPPAGARRRHGRSKAAVACAGEMCATVSESRVSENGG